MVFGAGEAAELLVKNLQGKGLSRLVITNRHYDKALELAGKFDGEAVPFANAL